MDTLDRYCEECGAANARAATICFACARPLDDSPLEQAEEDAGEKATPDNQPAAAPVYVQFTLTANSQTTRKLVRPQLHPQQPTPTLLHGHVHILRQEETGDYGTA